MKKSLRDAAVCISTAPVPMDNTSRISLSRQESFDRLKTQRHFDFVVVGGGIHGAAFARQASLHGFSVALFERGDYASGTSSRSSKMAHGGLRYLELFDFKQVFEGIKAREELFEELPHLVQPERFLIPIQKGQLWFTYKLGVGLQLYDLLVRNRERRHRWIPKDQFAANDIHTYPAHLSGCYQYTDGIMYDSRLVLENIAGAREHGALCVNHAEVKSIESSSGGTVTVEVRDLLEEREGFELSTRLLINCAGPWAPRVAGAIQPSVRYSRGSHLLFSKQWLGPSLFLPMEGKSRYYFVWPHFSGTMVGTTERETEELLDDPTPTQDEIEEILSRLQRDLPNSGLDRTTLHYAFAGVRTLPLRTKKGETGELSRKHIWSHADGILTLYGGKYTTACWTAREGLKVALKILAIKNNFSSHAHPPLPGARYPTDNFSHFRQQARAGGLSEQLSGLLVRRYGARVALFEPEEGDLEPLSDFCVQGEIKLAFQSDQAETLEDLMRRRIDVEYTRGHGLEICTRIFPLLKELRPQRSWDTELCSYRERLERLHRIMQTETRLHEAQRKIDPGQSQTA